MGSKVLTVTALTYGLKRLIEEQVILDGIWIKGELSNFTAHSSGHFYFTLKDEQARLSCVMFRNQARQINFAPENGQQVLVTGRMSVYEKNGNYQLYVDEMEPDGIGALYLAFDQLKQKLAQEGLFDAGRKQALPALPQRIGLITSPTGAAVQDMIKILRRRRPNLDILLIPALVQGNEAPGSLINALDKAEQIDDLDLVIIGRGGGSIEELWAFNDEKLARVIAAFPKPIISAVGHETDFTIADFVADLRAATPSAAAELAVPDQGQVGTSLKLLQKRLVQSMKYRFEQRRERLRQLQESRCFTDPFFQINQRRQTLDWLRERVKRSARQELQLERQRFANLAGKLDTLSPLATLGRGYAIARKQEGKVVMEVNQVELGEALFLRLAKGSLVCEVLEKEKS